MTILFRIGNIEKVRDRSLFWYLGINYYDLHNHNDDYTTHHVKSIEEIPIFDNIIYIEIDDENLLEIPNNLPESIVGLSLLLFTSKK